MDTLTRCAGEKCHDIPPNRTSRGRLGNTSLLHFGFVLLLTISSIAHADEPPLEEGFTRLDNGKDLSGWNGRHEGWSVVEGAMHVELRAAKGHLYSDHPHSADCIIRLQYRATPRGDSGVFVWGKQFQVRDFPALGPKEFATAAKPAGEWNDLELEITAGIAVVKLNGQVIEEKWPIGEQPKKGLGLQRERGDFTFRQIRLREKEPTARGLPN